MKKIGKTLLALGILMKAVSAATFVVLPGDSINEKIEAAADGDIIAIFGGNYAQDVLVNKQVRLVELANQDVWITGGITFSGVEDCPPLVGLKVGSNGKQIKVQDVTGLIIKDVVVPRVEVVNSTGIALQNVETSAEGFVEGVYTNKSKLSIIGGTHRNILQDAGTLVVNSSTINSLHARNSDQASETIVFRADVTEYIQCDSGGSKSWIGYSKAKGFISENADDAKAVLVGNNFYNDESHNVKITGANGSFLMCNNRFRSYNSHPIYIRGSHDEIVLQNNLITIWTNNFIIWLEGQSSKVVIRNNIIQGTRDARGPALGVSSPFGPLVVNNHYDYVQGGRLVERGVTGSNWSTGGPLTVEDNFFQLAEGSPCIDAGSEDARYNDRDGSRNDIGASGGSWFDPEGWTTENPVVISFDLSAEQILQGGNQSVEIGEIRAISGP